MWDLFGYQLSEDSAKTNSDKGTSSYGNTGNEDPVDLVSKT